MKLKKQDVINNVISIIGKDNAGEINYLLQEVLNCSYTELALKKEFSVREYNKIIRVSKLRANHIPLNKIFKRSYFYGREFYINDSVLAPRQETELLIDYALKEIKNRLILSPKLKVLDLCTGSGIIAITLYLELKNKDIKFYASDISKRALNVAIKNAKNLNADINFIKSDMFKNIKDNFDIIISNPPYIPLSYKDKLDKEVLDYDPKIALFGGEDGLDFYRVINDTCRLNKNGIMLLEIGENQAQSVRNIFSNYTVMCYNDYNNLNRICIIKR
jgi:release factor glutamine methyltransferase